MENSNPVVLTLSEYDYLVEKSIRFNQLHALRLDEIKNSSYVALNESDFILGMDIVDAVRENRKTNG